jgi:hypothetical protein
MPMRVEQAIDVERTWRRGSDVLPAHRIGFRAILERVPADYADFYQDPAVRALAASIYAADFDAYGYPR